MMVTSIALLCNKEILNMYVYALYTDHVYICIVYTCSAHVRTISRPCVYIKDAFREIYRWMISFFRLRDFAAQTRNEKTYYELAILIGLFPIK